MKKIVFVALLLVVNNALAQYKPMSEQSQVKFKIQNFGFDVIGGFTSLQGNIHFDPQNPSKDSFDVFVDASTINTGNSLRDSHLRETEYFDVKNYPRIHFVSTGVRPTAKKGTYLLTGILTIKARFKNISFPFAVTPSGNSVAFKGAFKINRKDFDVGGFSTISDELEVSLNIVARK
ncbi:MAG: YceI family protein [Flavipsychrobacter sp.]